MDKVKESEPVFDGRKYTAENDWGSKPFTLSVDSELLIG